MGRAVARAKSADLVVLLEDMAKPKDLPALPEGLSLLRVGTKADLLSAAERDSKAGSYQLEISAAKGHGVEQLLQEIGQRADAAMAESSDLVPWRERHVALLREAESFLKAALVSVDAGYELRAEDLRLASDRIGRISGAVDVEDLLDVIFSQFCIGK
jgi:tRNA modification GTPase